MKTYNLILLLIFFCFDFYGQKTRINNSQDDDLQFGNMLSESLIKQQYMPHEKDDKTYNIAFFGKGFNNDNVNNSEYIEFWGHGNKFLSILGPVQITLEGEKRDDFIKKIIQGFTYFKKNIINTRKFFEHYDIFLLNDIYFSFYMNREIPEYAIWIKYKKYRIEEPYFQNIIEGFESYYSK